MQISYIETSEYFLQKANEPNYFLSLKRDANKNNYVSLNYECYLISILRYSLGATAIFAEQVYVNIANIRICFQ